MSRQGGWGGSLSKLRYGHPRHDSIHTTDSPSPWNHKPLWNHWPLFLICLPQIIYYIDTNIDNVCSAQTAFIQVSNTYIDTNIDNVFLAQTAFFKIAICKRFQYLTVRVGLSHSHSLLSGQASGTFPKNTTPLHTPSRHGLATTGVSL